LQTTIKLKERTNFTLRVKLTGIVPNPTEFMMRMMMIKKRHDFGIGSASFVW